MIHICTSDDFLAYYSTITSFWCVENGDNNLTLVCSNPVATAVLIAVFFFLNLDIKI